jgi:hypothetical protein
MVPLAVVTNPPGKAKTGPSLLTLNTVNGSTFGVALTAGPNRNTSPALITTSHSPSLQAARFLPSAAVEIDGGGAPVGDGLGEALSGAGEAVVVAEDGDGGCAVGALLPQPARTRARAANTTMCRCMHRLIPPRPATVPTLVNFLPTMRGRNVQRSTRPTTLSGVASVRRVANDQGPDTTDLWLRSSVWLRGPIGSARVCRRSIEPRHAVTIVAEK